MAKKYSKTEFVDLELSRLFNNGQESKIIASLASLNVGAESLTSIRPKRVIEENGQKVLKELSLEEYRSEFPRAVFNKSSALISGEKLVKDGSLPEKARGHSNVKALEMESAGFLSACFLNGDIDCLVVRSISDNGDPNKKNFEGMQYIVALTAMLCVKDFLINYYQLPKRD